MVFCVKNSACHHRVELHYPAAVSQDIPAAHHHLAQGATAPKAVHNEDIAETESALIPFYFSISSPLLINFFAPFGNS